MNNDTGTLPASPSAFGFGLLLAAEALEEQLTPESAETTLGDIAVEHYLGQRKIYAWVKVDGQTKLASSIRVELGTGRIVYLTQGSNFLREFTALLTALRLATRAAPDQLFEISVMRRLIRAYNGDVTVTKGDPVKSLGGTLTWGPLPGHEDAYFRASM